MFRSLPLVLFAVGCSPDFLGDPLDGDGEVDRVVWTADALWAGESPDGPLDAMGFALPEAAAPPWHDLSGDWTITADGPTTFDTLRDDLWLASNPDFVSLPPLSFTLVQDGSHVVPVDRGWQRTWHNGYDAIVSPGRVWSEDGDGGATRISLPVQLVERNGNCTHDGMFTWLVDDDDVSAAGWQVVQENCLHHTFDAWGATTLTWEAGTPPEAADVAAAWEEELAGRLPTRPLEDLALWGVDVDALGADLTPDSRSALWVLYDGVLFVEPAATRAGHHPFPESRPLPSFSTAKSLLVGIGAWWLAATHGEDFRRTPVGELVPEVAGIPSWDPVQVGHLLDMASGHYVSTVHGVDEDGPTLSGFFFAEYHWAKMSWATAFPYRDPPGTQFVYHSSDSYLAMAAMQASLDRADPGTDLFDALWEDVYGPLGVDPASRVSLRAWVDGPADGQPYGGYGMWWTLDSLAKLSAFVAEGAPGLVGADAALQRDPTDPGLDTVSEAWRYNDQVWAYQLGAYDGLPCEAWVPQFIGYGGTTVALLPSGVILGVHGDGDGWWWQPAARALYDLEPWCD